MELSNQYYLRPLLLHVPLSPMFRSPRTSVILEAGSPFTAYCRINALCEADASKEILWFDPFVSGNVFTRYLQDLQPGVQGTLVTSEPGPSVGNRDKTRWANFLDISQLFAKERGDRRYPPDLPAELA